MSYKNRTAAKILYTLIYIMCVDKYIYRQQRRPRLRPPHRFEENERRKKHTNAHTSSLSGSNKYMNTSEHTFTQPIGLLGPVHKCACERAEYVYIETIKSKMLLLLVFVNRFITSNTSMFQTMLSQFYAQFSSFLRMCVCVSVSAYVSVFHTGFCFIFMSTKVSQL